MVREDGEIKELGKKWAQNPDSMVFVQLADAYRRAGDLEQSVEVCLQGLERHPDYTTARVILGRNYLDLGKLDASAAEFRQIETVDPENILAQRMLGQIALHKGQFAEAIARQQKVLALDPDDGTAQELLQQALTQVKQSESAAGAGAKPPSGDGHSEALKVADIYIKKRAWDKATEVVQEILTADPGHGPAQKKLNEIVTLKEAEGAEQRTEEKRKAEEEARRKAEEEARRKAEEEARRKAEEEARRKAEEEARRKAEEEARRKAEEEARRKAEEEARRKAEEEARRKAEEEARRKAEEEARRKAEEEARRKAEEEARRKAEEEARRKAEEEARRKAEEEVHRKAEKEADLGDRAKFTADDILSVISGSAEDLIENEGAPAAAGRGKVSASAAEARGLIDAFLKAQAIEASLLLDTKGRVLESRGDGDAAQLGPMAHAVFQATARAAANTGFGGLKQLMISGGDNRQILFLALGAGILVAVTGRDTNVGLLRIAVHDLIKRA